MLGTRALHARAYGSGMRPQRSRSPLAQRPPVAGPPAAAAGWTTSRTEGVAGGGRAASSGRRRQRRRAGRRGPVRVRGGAERDPGVSAAALVRGDGEPRGRLLSARTAARPWLHPLPPSPSSRLTGQFESMARLSGKFADFGAHRACRACACAGPRPTPRGSASHLRWRPRPPCPPAAVLSDVAGKRIYVQQMEEMGERLKVRRAARAGPSQRARSLTRAGGAGARRSRCGRTALLGNFAGANSARCARCAPPQILVARLRLANDDLARGAMRTINVQVGAGGAGERDGAAGRALRESGNTGSGPSGARLPRPPPARPPSCWRPAPAWR